MLDRFALPLFFTLILSDIIVFFLFIWNWVQFFNEFPITTVILGWLFVPIYMIFKHPFIMIPYIVFIETIRRSEK